MGFKIGSARIGNLHQPEKRVGRIYLRAYMQAKWLLIQEVVFDYKMLRGLSSLKIESTNLNLP